MPEGGFYCLGVFWGVLAGVPVLSEVSGRAFYSNLIYINGAPIKSLTFSKRRGVPDVSNIKMSQHYGHFYLLGTLERGFRV